MEIFFYIFTPNGWNGLQWGDGLGVMVRVVIMLDGIAMDGKILIIQTSNEWKECFKIFTSSVWFQVIFTKFRRQNLNFIKLFLRKFKISLRQMKEKVFPYLIKNFEGGWINIGSVPTRCQTPQTTFTSDMENWWNEMKTHEKEWKKKKIPSTFWLNFLKFF